MNGMKIVNFVWQILGYMKPNRLQIYYLNPPIDIVVPRSNERGNGHDKKMTRKKRLSEIERYDTLMDDPKYKDYIEVRANLNMDASNQISDEIINILEPDNKTATLDDFL